MRRSCSGLTFMLCTPSSGVRLEIPSIALNLLLWRLALVTSDCQLYDNNWQCQGPSARPRGAGLSGLSGPSFNPVLGDFAAEGVAMHPKRVGAFGETAVATAEDPGDEALFELSCGVLEADALVDHFFNQFLEPVANHCLASPLTPAPARSDGGT